MQSTATHLGIKSEPDQESVPVGVDMGLDSSCLQCSFQGLSQKLRLHQLLGCRSQVLNATGKCVSIQSSQQAAEPYLLRILQPCSMQFESLPNAVGSGVESCDLCSFIASPRTMRLHQLLGCCPVILDINKSKPSDQKVKNLSRSREKSFTCEFCNFSCKLLCAFKRHKVSHSVVVKPLSCKMCSLTHLNIHHLSHTGVKTCKIRPYKSVHSNELKIDNLIHTGEKIFTCKICHYKCDQSNDLKVHNLIHSQDKPFSCNICSYKCISLYLLKLHNSRHAGDKSFSYKTCNYECARVTYLKKDHFTNNGEKQFSCQTCSYKCSSLRYLKIHNLTHTGEKLFSCKICSFTCVRSSYLKKHNLKHSKVQSADLKKHCVIQTEKMSFSCMMCTYKCARGSYLKKHNLTHSADKPFSCKVCGYKCISFYLLKIHHLTHRG